MGEFAFVERDKIEFLSDVINDNTELLISEDRSLNLSQNNAVKSMLMVQKGKGIDLVSI